MLREDYCDYDTSVALEELGFREPTLAHYMENHPNNLIYHYCDDACVEDCYRRVSSRDGVFGAPTLYEAQKWLRKNHNLHITTKPYPCEDGLMWMYEIRRITRYLVCVIKNKTGFREAEEALLEGLKGAVKFLKEEK